MSSDEGPELDITKSQIDKSEEDSEQSGDSDSEMEEIEYCQLRCDCGRVPKHKVSHTKKNPLRVFFCCPSPIGRQCGYFIWADELNVGDEWDMCRKCRSIQEEINEIQREKAIMEERMKLKAEISSLKSELEEIKKKEIDGKKEMLEETERLKLEAENSSLKSELEEMKRMIMKLLNETELEEKMKKRMRLSNETDLVTPVEKLSNFEAQIKDEEVFNDVVPVPKKMKLSNDTDLIASPLDKSSNDEAMIEDEVIKGAFRSS